jgi:putative SOS response-associated peptidase YedK
MASFTILVGPAAAKLAHIHVRTRLTPRRSTWASWLDPEQKDGRGPRARSGSSPVALSVPPRLDLGEHSSKNEGPRCIEPIDS